MARRANVSAGMLLYRRVGDQLEYFLAHPGGPFWKRREEGAWTIPKGLVEAGEEPLQAAVREFREETGITPREPFLDLGSVRQKSGKVVHAWAWEGDADPSSIRSNQARIEFPRGSGRFITHPEVDRCGWFRREEAERLMNPSQVPLLERLDRALAPES